MDTYTGHDLVFLVGCPRSGTTWLQRLLASHPQIRTGQESHLFASHIGPALREWRRSVESESLGRPIGLACYHTEEEFVVALRQYALTLLDPMVRDLAPGEYFLEKTPSHALYLSEIHALFPDAKVIHLIRDPRDVVASLLAASRTWGRRWAPGGAWKAAKMWVRHVGAVHQASESLPSLNVLEIRYEELCTRPHVELVRIADLLGLEWSVEDLDRAIHANGLDSLRSGGGTPIRLHGHFRDRGQSIVHEPEGFLRRGRPGGWRQDLRWLDRALVRYRARSWLERTGYLGAAGSSTPQRTPGRSEPVTMHESAVEN